MTEDDKSSDLNKVDLMLEETDGGTITRKHAKLEGKESTKELLSMADGWMKGNTVQVELLDKKRSKKCSKCSGYMEEAERKWYCPNCRATPSYEEEEL